MASKPKWAIVDVDKLDQIFTLMDKVNRAAGFGMLTPEDKTAVVDKLKDEAQAILFPETLQAPPAAPMGQPAAAPVTSPVTSPETPAAASTEKEPAARAEASPEFKPAA